MDAFYAAYHDGRYVEPEEIHMAWILAPSILHMAPETYLDYPYVIRQMIRQLLARHIVHGWAGNPAMVRHPGGSRNA